MTSKIIRYLLNVFLLVLVGYSILPDFSLNEKEFEKVSGLVSSIRHENYDNRRDKPLLFNNLSRDRIIITIADSQYHEYYVSDIYKEYWPKLLEQNVEGRPIVLYLGDGKQQEDPFRIEVDGATIYGTDIRFKRNILIIVFTLALSIYNLYRYFKPDDYNSNFLKLGDKYSSIKNYFLNKRN